jgi:hypothetical protein
LNCLARRGEFERLNFRDGYSNEPVETREPFDPMAAASPGKDYEASFFENSSEKENIFLKDLRSDRGATRRILLVENGAGNHYNYSGGSRRWRVQRAKQARRAQARAQMQALTPAARFSSARATSPSA